MTATNELKINNMIKLLFVKKKNLKGRTINGKHSVRLREVNYHYPATLFCYESFNKQESMNQQNTSYSLGATLRKPDEYFMMATRSDIRAPFSFSAIGSIIYSVEEGSYYSR